EKLNRSHYFLTGNPRLPTFQREPLPESCVAMVNANFTYGVFADWRERWTENVVSALRQEDVEFFLSRHPRDDGDYRGLPIKESSAFSVNEQILSSSIVISRFSQVIYEAMLKGRYVIYYNPHGETEDTIVSSKSPALRVAKNPEELQEALSYLKSHPEEPFEHYPEFLEWHCGPQDGKAVDRCVEGIIAVARGLVERSGKDKFPYF
ncbi:MAG: CDP-glycerol glycerophosphotransferase family protein, partial [Bdellovibrionales bacterium]|nr:CDP-glycerol glycerophosphotransferase family protein [Bdellovibrionales bacterium]